jgi:hypothetical protein
MYRRTLPRLVARQWGLIVGDSADRVSRARDSSDGRAKQLVRARNRRPRVDEKQQKRGRTNNVRQVQVEHRRALGTMTLAAHRAAAVVPMDRFIMRGRYARRGSSTASLVRPRIRARMVRAVSRVHSARLPFGRSYRCMRHLPLHSHDKLKHQQRRNHPICESVTHNRQRTPVTGTGEEARRNPHRGIAQTLMY